MSARIDGGLKRASPLCGAGVYNLPRESGLWEIRRLRGSDAGRASCIADEGFERLPRPRIMRMMSRPWGADPNGGGSTSAQPKTEPTQGTTTDREEMNTNLVNSQKGSIRVSTMKLHPFFGRPSQLLDLAAADKEVLHLRDIFAKDLEAWLDGAAGLRLRADLLAGPNLWLETPCVTAWCPRPALKTRAGFSTRQKINADLRNDVLSWLAGN